MALCNLKIFSESLGMQTDVNVIIPQSNLRGEIGTNISGRKGNLKCLYLLHGLSDNYSIWERRTSIERYAQDRGICVVMPDGARSFYTDMKYGGKYYTYIAKELPQIIREMFPQLPTYTTKALQTTLCPYSARAESSPKRTISLSLQKYVRKIRTDREFLWVKAPRTLCMTTTCG